MSLSTHSANSVMVETLKTCDVSEPNYSGGNGLRDRNVVCDVTSMLSGEQMYCEINVIREAYVCEGSEYLLKLQAR